MFSPLETCRVFEDGGPESRSIEPSEDDLQFKPGFMEQAVEFLRLIDTGVDRREYSIESVLPAMDLAEKLTAACLDDQGPHGSPKETPKTEKRGD